MVALIEAFKLDPEKQILLSTAQRDGDYYPFYLEQQKKELLELAEQVHKKLTNDLVNETMNSIFDKLLFLSLDNVKVYS